MDGKIYFSLSKTQIVTFNIPKQNPNLELLNIVKYYHIYNLLKL